MAGHTAQEDHKAAPANAMPQAVPKPTQANVWHPGKQGCSDELVSPSDKPCSLAGFRLKTRV